MKTKTTNWDYRPYNGHPNWQLWNVSLWTSGDEKSYFHIVSLIEKYGVKQATRLLSEALRGQSTPDGAKYTKAAIGYALSSLA